jgi:hypothetical protein
VITRRGAGLTTGESSAPSSWGQVAAAEPLTVGLAPAVARG